MAELRRESPEALSEKLTRREREILGLLADGLSGPEIAEKLTLALSTVKWHQEHLYSKLGVNSKRAAVNRARELGLLSGGAEPDALEPRLAPTHTLHNLPLPVTRFFGREAEIADIRARLAEERLVTLTGLGGVGKTRLALRAAEALVTDYPDGLWFVELAALADGDLVAQQIATTLGVRDDPGRPVLETLISFLRERQSLLVLDNCEHLLEGCARVCEALLRACPRLRLLTCSREPLAVMGEARLLVPSLPFPEAGQPLSPEDVGGYAAVRLFTDRARLVRPDYQVARHNAAAVAGICQRVDGIPLAIEMAAARINTLSADQLVARLDDAFGLLTGGSRTALPRQQTLRATIDWSYQLLSPEERLLLQRLAIFAGGCTLAAAEAVCAGDGLAAPQVLDLLASLVAKSMLVAERDPGGETRYHLLEMVRQYAREKLETAGDSNRLSRQHRDYCLRLTESNNPESTASERALWEQKLGAERDNIRQALEWSFTDTLAVDAAPRLVLACGWTFPTWQEGYAWSKRAVAWCQAHPSVPTPLYLNVLAMASALASLNNLDQGIALATQAVDIARGLGAADPGDRLLMETLMGLGMRYLEQGDCDQASGPCAEMEAIFLRLPLEQHDLNTKLGVLFQLTLLADGQCRHADAKALASETARLLEVSGRQEDLCGPWSSLGKACLGLGEYEQARAYFQDALRRSTRMSGDGAHNAQADARRWLADLDIRTDNLTGALEHCRACIRQANLIPDYNLIASGLGLAAIIAARQGQPERTAHLSGASLAMYTRQQRRPWEDASLDTLLPGWRDGSAQAAITQAFDLGQRMSSEQAIAYALDDTPQ